LHLCTDDQQQKDRQKEADQKAKEKEADEKLSYEQLRAASYKPKEPKEPSNSAGSAAGKYTVSEEDAAGKGEKDKAVSVDVPVRLPPLNNASVRLPPPLLPLPRLALGGCAILPPVASWPNVAVQPSESPSDPEAPGLQGSSEASAGVSHLHTPHTNLRWICTVGRQLSVTDCAAGCLFGRRDHSCQPQQDWVQSCPRAV
jgi:hypothetical protein